MNSGSGGHFSSWEILLRSLYIQIPKVISAWSRPRRAASQLSEPLWAVEFREMLNYFIQTQTRRRPCLGPYRRCHPLATSGVLIKSF